MSHFSTLDTELTEERYVLAALRSLGFAIETGNVRVAGFVGQQATADIRASRKSGGYDIGLRKVRGSYQIIADWWGVRGISKAQFVQQLTQRYAYYATRTILEEKGFTLASEKVAEDGTLHLVLNRVS